MLELSGPMPSVKFVGGVLLLLAYRVVQRDGPGRGGRPMRVFDETQVNGEIFEQITDERHRIRLVGCTGIFAAPSAVDTRAERERRTRPVALGRRHGCLPRVRHCHAEERRRGWLSEDGRGWLG